jgi:hypothetical protein
MPQLSGEEILKTLKKQFRNKAPARCGHPSHRDGAGIAKHSGAGDFPEKLFDISKLVNKIQLYIYSPIIIHAYNPAASSGLIV